ncbi:MAG: class D beta-lactamase [Geobacter sp.]|nr:class D beta-lactamase [Geobacter sp.]
MSISRSLYPRRIFSVLFMLFSLSQVAFAATVTEVPELGEHFRKYGLTGTFVLYDLSADTMYVYDRERSGKLFPPASTFKIVNSLIGLDMGAVKSVDEVLPYGSKPQPVKEWEKDMGLRDAIRLSNVPIFQELARRIGLERMAHGVKRLGYGNMEIGGIVDRFWLDGPLAISAVEQAEFLARLAQGKLPIDPKAIAAVKEITLQEQTKDYRLHAKTGWLMSAKPQIGWYVGWIVRGDRIYSFALNIDMANSQDAPKRVSVARECLKALGRL